MKYLGCYKELFGCNSEQEVFNFLVDNLKLSDITWDYFVNWDKVFTNVREVEIALNILNYLIGKNNFDDEFRMLLKEHPEVIKVLPSLIVTRDTDFDILVDYQSKVLKYENYDFSKANPTDEDIERYLHFVTQTGLKHLICCGKVKSLVDYMFGVEAGIDSNGRKNRGGHSMENIVEIFVRDLCKRKGYQYLKEANADKIKSEFGIIVPVDKSSRRYDYVVNTGKELVIFEVNFYGSGGSKLKSTAGEYRNLYDVLQNRFKFIWITDGNGWRTTSRPLYETFDHNDFVLSLAMLEKNILEYILGYVTTNS